MTGQHGQHVRADLIGRVTIRGDAVSTGKNNIHLTTAHQRGRHIIADKGRVDFLTEKFPASQP